MQIVGCSGASASWQKKSFSMINLAVFETLAPLSNDTYLYKL